MNQKPTGGFLPVKEFCLDRDIDYSETIAILHTLNTDESEAILVKIKNRWWASETVLNDLYSRLLEQAKNRRKTQVKTIARQRILRVFSQEILLILSLPIPEEEQKPIFFNIQQLYDKLWQIEEPSDVIGAVNSILAKSGLQRPVGIPRPQDIVKKQKHPTGEKSEAMTDNPEKK